MAHKRMTLYIIIALSKTTLIINCPSVHYHTDSNLVSNSDTNSKNTGISSDESLSEDNISTNLNSNTEYSNKTSNIDHSITDSDSELSNKKSNIYHENGKHVGSTGNFQTHLNTHGITKPTKVIDVTPQSTITKMFHCAARQNTRQKESIDRALVEWVVTNLQPLYVLKNESFIKFIYTLNPYYKIPSDKHVKALIYQSYNYSVECLKTLLATEIVTCGLTCDFWTACSKSGYRSQSCWAVVIISRLVLYSQLLRLLLEIEEEEENIVNLDDDLEIITMADGKKYSLLSTRDKNITNITNIEQNENLNLFSIMFGSDAISKSDKNEVNKYLKLDQIPATTNLLNW
ncbi:39786_t:CDS:2 [Gigaspora margarita]|uniref:39786_t:CDS:1 n=1 Tax=Gigaspora margarita TaxID=4874 RepID=A0ABN7VN87_GIGMA|nr:39786_t:CDS:2 [Gigaspora margarita]